MARKASNKALTPRRSRLLRWLSALSQVTSCSLYGSSTLAALCRTGYWGSTISGSLSHLVAVFLEIPSLRLAWRTDRPSRKTRRRNLLKVPTLITPGHPCSKNEQDRPMKWLKFGCKFPSKWLSFQSQSTENSLTLPISLFFKKQMAGLDFGVSRDHFSFHGRSHNAQS